MKLALALALVVSSSYLEVARGDITKSSYSGSSGLNDLAKASGKYLGTAADQDINDEACLKVLEDVKEFGMITPGNAMKWDATEPTQNQFSYTTADKIVEIAKTSGAQVRCHTLLWHSQVPQWVQALEKEELLSALENHITTVMTHFGDDCYAWDVANEVMGDDANMRDSFWYQKTGMEFLSTAFKTANSVKKSLGLETKLYYNDYNTNTVNAKSTAVLSMIKNLLDEGITVDGVGFQSHQSYSDASTTEDLVTNLNRFTALGLDVAYTEVDVVASSSSPSEAEQEQQKQVYTNIVAACKEVKQCVGVTIWGYSDQYSWLSTKSPLPWYQPGGENSELVRKSLYDGIVAGWGTDGSGGNSTSAAVSGSSASQGSDDSSIPAVTTSTTSNEAANEASTSTNKCTGRRRLKHNP